MDQVLELSNAEQADLRETAERGRLNALERLREQEHARQEAQEADLQERAFLRAYPGEERQTEAIREFCRGTPFTPGSQTGRSFAISAWWTGLNRFEKAEFLE